jgi:AAA family ATP:ADP antiporter
MVSRALIVAMLCAAAVTAEFVGGKATRDALFLTSLGPTALPAMFVATGLCSLVLVVLEWWLRPAAPAATAVVIYLHVSGAGPLLASGFWLVASERFDPSTAKTRFGQIAGAGTLGGLLGALLSERVAAQFGAPSMLLFLAALQFVAAFWVRGLSRRLKAVAAAAPQAAATPAPLASGLRAAVEAPHLRHLMALVLLGTTGAALLEYLFKTSAVQTFGTGDALLRFFAVYYAGTSLIAFILQMVGNGGVLRRFGLALTTSSPSIALLAGGVGSVVAPGFGGLLVARAGESILRAAWFRAGYELFFTPMPEGQKRAAKPIIDVALDRLGEAVGGGIVRVVIVVIPLVAQSQTILAIAMLCSIGAILAASQLNRWYLRTLEQSLVRQGGDIDWSETGDGMTRQMLTAVRRSRAAVAQAATSGMTGTGAVDACPADVMVDVQDIIALRCGSPRVMLAVLTRPEGLSAGLVAHVIPLLARADMADHAMFALRKVVEERVGELIDAMLNPNQDDAVRRRLARVLAVCVSQRAVDGLMLALDDPRFEVRFQAARSLVAIVERNPLVHVDPQRIEEVVLREIASGRPLWHGERELTGPDGGSPFNAFVRNRAGQSFGHVFTLLSLVVSREPLQIAFRSLNSTDRRLRGTAVEYLEEALPSSIRDLLWPFIAPDRVTPARAADRRPSESSSRLVELSQQPG